MRDSQARLVNRHRRVALVAWPRLMDLHTAATYSSIAESTWRDYIADGLIEPVPMPGSTLRDRKGQVIAHGKTRRIAKILLLKEDIDALIDKYADRPPAGGVPLSQGETVVGTQAAGRSIPGEAQR